MIFEDVGVPPRAFGCGVVCVGRLRARRTLFLRLLWGSGHVIPSLAADWTVQAAPLPHWLVAGCVAVETRLGVMAGWYLAARKRDTLVMQSY